MKVKLAITCFLAGMILAFTSGTAVAALSEWTAEAAGPVYLNAFSYRHYSFELDIEPAGFTPGLDEVYEYALTISLADDAQDAGEWALIDLPGLISDKLIEVDTGDYTLGMSFRGLESLNETGILGVDLYALVGDFYFMRSQLHAVGNSVPLPASVLLLGTGLLGVAGLRRRRTAS